MFIETLAENTKIDESIVKIPDLLPEKLISKYLNAMFYKYFDSDTINKTA